MLEALIGSYCSCMLYSCWNLSVAFFRFWNQNGFQSVRITGLVYEPDKTIPAVRLSPYSTLSFIIVDLKRRESILLHFHCCCLIPQASRFSLRFSLTPGSAETILLSFNDQAICPFLEDVKPVASQALSSLR